MRFDVLDRIKVDEVFCYYDFNVIVKCFIFFYIVGCKYYIYILFKNCICDKILYGFFCYRVYFVIRFI